MANVHSAGSSHYRHRTRNCVRRGEEHSREARYKQVVESQMLASGAVKSGATKQDKRSCAIQSTNHSAGVTSKLSHYSAEAGSYNAHRAFHVTNSWRRASSVLLLQRRGRSIDVREYV